MKESDFCVKIRLPAEKLRLSVSGIGNIAFPIEKNIAEQLVGMASPSNFGQREKTIFDPAVRNSHEISGDLITMETESWPESLAVALRQIGEDLGFAAEAQLSAELQNMVLYGPGQFFTKHQDSEKIDGMIATLVILLPSSFEGGAFVIEQNKIKKVFRSPRNSSHLELIAFYADCHHEVKPVSAGYRIALTYNICSAGRRDRNGVKVSPYLTDALKRYFSAPNIASIPEYRLKKPRWLLYMFDHQYTPKSYGWESLKGKDVERAINLKAAAQEAGLEIHLVLADIRETWHAFSEHDDFDSSWRDYSYYDQPRRRRPAKKQEYELVDLIEEEIVLTNWLDEQGKSAPLLNGFMDRSMIASPLGNDQFDPYDSEYEGFTGNAGNTLDRWYHRAGIVLWEKSEYWSSRFYINPWLTIADITKLLESDLKTGLAALRQILPFRSLLNDHEDEHLQIICDAALSANDSNLAYSLLTPISFPAIGKMSVEGLAKVLRLYGETWGLRLFKESHGQLAHFQIEPIADIEGFVRLLGDEFPQISVWMLDRQVDAIKGDDAESRESVSEAGKNAARRHKAAAAVLIAAYLLRNEKVRDLMITHCLRQPRLYPTPTLLGLLTDANQPAAELSSAETWRQLIETCRNRADSILDDTRKSDDWSILDDLECRCKDCMILAKPRRRHVHQIISDADLPVKHETLRQGSPQKLVITKMPALHKRRARLRAEAMQWREILLSKF